MTMNKKIVEDRMMARRGMFLWVWCIVGYYFSNFAYAGFAGDTLVKTPYGYVPIKQLVVGDAVYGINRDGIVSPTIITHKVSYQRKKYLVISVQDQTLITAQGQKFLLPLEHVWRKAKKLCEKDAVLDAWHKSVQITVIKNKQKAITFYDIRLQKDHAFMVTKADIVVHNMPLFSIGMLITFEGLSFTVEAVWAGVCLFGLWLGSKFSPKNGNLTAVCQQSAGGFLGAPDPEDDPEGGSYRNGRYEESPKHNPNSPKNVGKPPRNGQEALDNSISVKGSTQRVAIQDGKFVILKKTAQGTYHGYVVEKFSDLVQSVKNALYENGLVKSVNSGKIK